MEINQVALSYLLTAERCEERRLLDGGNIEILLIPSATNRAFSCELYLKSILEKEENQQRGHELDVLFDKLSDASKQAVIVETGYSLEEFNSNLKSIKNLFVEWRYFYDNSEAQLPFEFLKKFSYSLKECFNKI